MDQPDTGDGQQWVPTSRKRDRQVGGRVYSSKSDSNRSNHLYIGNTHQFSQVWGISNNFSTNTLRSNEISLRSWQIHWDPERSLWDLVSSFRNLTRSSHVLARSSRYWPVWFRPFLAHFDIFCLLQVWPTTDHHQSISESLEPTHLTGRWQVWMLETRHGRVSFRLGKNPTRSDPWTTLIFALPKLLDFCLKAIKHC